MMIRQLFLLVQLLVVSVFSIDGKCGYDALPGGRIPTSRILNAETSQRCQWPWMVSVRRTGTKDMCAGVLVNEDKVLTTARCSAALQSLGGQFEVVIGEYNIEVEDEKDGLGKPTETIVPVTSMTQHPEYDGICISNDIAVVRLAKAVEYGECALPVCVTKTRGTDENCDEYIEECVMAGWGKYKAVGAERSPKLRWAYTEMLGPEVCSAIYRYGDNSTLPENIFCLDESKNKQTACLGDEGGMVLCNLKGTWVLKGLISLTSCGDSLPSLAVDIASSTINDFVSRN
ncbi:hypothetical protein SNE40_008244 [Patella caerulea]|uniref:Peptidase S1 domain-containing protein n=1 Tax=Patella caerulea TaxID=87958 RepID=A0AAN8PYM0_PATCE